MTTDPERSVRDPSTALHSTALHSTTLRGVAVVGLTGLGLGVLMGLCWVAITPDVVIEITGNGPLPTLETEDRWFDADGWFAVLGVLAGLVLAAVAWWRLRRHALAMVLSVVAAGLLTALTAWWVGGLAGPDDPGELADLAVGSAVVAALGLRAMAVLLVPAIIAVGTVVLLAALVVPQEGANSPQ